MRACLQIALQHLYLVHDDPVLALPWQLGSTLSGGVWSSYLKLLADLAVANPQVSILLVQRSANSPSLHAALSPWAECGTRFMPDVHSEWPARPRFLRVTLLRRQTADALPSVLGWTLAAGHSCTRVMFDHLGIYVRSLDFVRLCSGLVIHEHQEALVTDYACLLGDSVFRAASSASQRMGRGSLEEPSVPVDAVDAQPLSPSRPYIWKLATQRVHLDALSAGCRQCCRAFLSKLRCRAFLGNLRSRSTSRVATSSLPAAALLPERVFTLTDLEEFRRLVSSFPEDGIVLVAFEFSGALATRLRAKGKPVITCDFRAPEGTGCAYRGDVREVIGLTKWAAIFFVGPNCFQHLVGDRDCLESKVRDGRAYWAGATVLWCICSPHTDHLLVEQPNVLAHRYIELDLLPGVAVAAFRTSDYAPTSAHPRDKDKFMRLTTRNLSFVLPHALRSQFDFANPDERDRSRSTWEPFHHLCDHVSQAVPITPPLPPPLYNEAIIRFARQWHLGGNPVPHDFRNPDARPSSAAEREYQWQRGHGDQRRPLLAEPHLFLEPTHEVVASIIESLLDLALSLFPSPFDLPPLVMHTRGRAVQLVVLRYGCVS